MPTNESSDPKEKIKKYISFTERIGEIFDFIFPQRCISCNGLLNERNKGKIRIFCNICEESIELRGDNFCPMCGIRHLGVTGESLCSDCIKNPKPYDRVFYNFIYGGCISDAIKSFKYNHNLLVGNILTIKSFESLSNHIQSYDPDIIIPVPLHFLKYFVRSFSPTVYIASTISKILRIPIGFNILRKIKYTKSQVGLQREERLKNLKGSFTIIKKSKSKVEDKTVLLVDDVYTTGATVSICAKLLKDSGAKSVIVFILARGE